jgi:uncharacterized protein with NRDE domain
MCIALLSTAHPDYPFILLSNRDETLSRPTLPLDWWDAPDTHVLGGRDLQRAERGTWLGVTKGGRVAVLTNFREPGMEIAKNKSRGGITNGWLVAEADGEGEEAERAFAERLMSEMGIHDMGGFTLLFGTLRKGRHAAAGENKSEPRSTATSNTELPGLARISNRTTFSSASAGLPRILTNPGETHALSNSHFGDPTWAKCIHGEQLLRQALHGHTVRHRGDESKLLERCFEILSLDLLPQRQVGEDWDTWSSRMRSSVYIDAEKGDDPMWKMDRMTLQDETEKGRLSPEAYGTTKQSVVLVNAEGKVTFVERTLWDKDGRAVDKTEQERRYEFDIEGWDQGALDHDEHDGDELAGSPPTDAGESDFPPAQSAPRMEASTGAVTKLTAGGPSGTTSVDESSSALNVKILARL